MITSFKIRPHPRSPRFLLVKVFKTIAEWKVDLASEESPDCPLLEGNYQAGHVGHRKVNKLGTIYLVHNENFLRIAVHELLHAAVYYVSEVRNFNFEQFLTRSGEMVSDTEEAIAETLENYFNDFQAVWTRKLPRLKLT